MKSIIRQEPGTCYLCGRDEEWLDERGTWHRDPLECHHVFGGSNRRQSEKYGLKVMLHGSECHRNGTLSVEQCREAREALQEKVQEEAMAYYGWSEDDWRERFGKSYIR